MEKFMLIIREDLSHLKKMTFEQRKANALIMMEWVKSLADSRSYIMGDALEAHGRYISKTEVISDGPFIESKEGVSGVILFKAENIEQATAIAQANPLVLRGQAVVEVRPIMSFGF